MAPSETNSRYIAFLGYSSSDVWAVRIGRLLPRVKHEPFCSVACLLSRLLGQDGSASCFISHSFGRKPANCKAVMASGKIGSRGLPCALFAFGQKMAEPGLRRLSKVLWWLGRPTTQICHFRF